GRHELVALRRSGAPRWHTLRRPRPLEVVPVVLFRVHARARDALAGDRARVLIDFIFALNREPDGVAGHGTIEGPAADRARRSGAIEPQRQSLIERVAVHLLSEQP